MSILHNDEGMWLPYELPHEKFKEQFDFTPDDKWSEHVMKACARLNSGGSGSFVSPYGLIITNHHVAESILQDMSSQENDYVENGFLAETQEKEVQVPHEEVNVLWEVEDVTDRVQKAVDDSMSTEQSHKARQAEISQIEDESYQKTGLRSNVVTLYQGGLYHLYRYKKYTDVRLVFAPEYAIAGFGGDFDNYEYPRYNLDIAFLRVYENGKPADTPHYFRWAEQNPGEDDVVFVAGHPGSTDRLSTMARIKDLRDESLPYLLNMVRRREILFQQFAGRNGENKRIAHQDLHGMQNIRKRFQGQLDALLDPHFLAQKEKQEKELRTQVEGGTEMKNKYGDAWDEIEEAEEKWKQIRRTYNLLEGGSAFLSEFFGIARALVRLEEEDKKSNGERLPEYTDANRESLLEELFSPAPIYPHFEEFKLTDSLSYLAEELGYDDPLVQKVLEGMSPAERAQKLVTGTQLADVALRKKLTQDTKPTAYKSDTFISLALLVDEEARSVRKTFEEEVKERRRQAYAKIASARFDLYGTDVYPDATFTLRVAGGHVRGYKENGQYIQPHTTVGGVFRHAENHNYIEPWALPDRWQEKKETLQDSNSAFNFVSTNDTHGGNSGSPVIDKDLYIHGVLFDGNIHANATTFMYVDEVARSVSVHMAGVTEALDKVYGASNLLVELRGK